MEPQKEGQKEKPDLPASALFEKAVEDAQLLAAHATRVREKIIDGETLHTLITAKRLLEKREPISVEFEVEFWLAYQYIVGLVRPVTADSIKADQSNQQPIDSFFRRVFKPIPVLSQWFKPKITNPRRAAGQYIAFTLFVLAVLLVLQIYWVIGNQLNTQLADLLQRETELSQKISENRQEYSAIEVRFKQDEANSESFKASGVYTFYTSPEWERDTLENASAKGQLEADLASLKSQIERSSDILLRWSSLWYGFINQEKQSGAADQGDQSTPPDQYSSQIKSIQWQIDRKRAERDSDPDASKQIRALRQSIFDKSMRLMELRANPQGNSGQILSLESEIDSLRDRVSQPELADQIISQLNQDIVRLEEERASLLSQQQSANKREAARQVQLAGQFVLVILQSYLLPLLYGILGAGTYALRFLSREVETVTYSEEAGIQHLLRFALGALAGIMVGWFSFLIPNETTTFVGSISPLAVAFLVGYNIELFFSLMDKAINWIRKPSSQEQQKAEEEQRIAEAEKKKYIMERKKQVAEEKEKTDEGKKQTAGSQKKSPPQPPSGQPSPA